MVSRISMNEKLELVFNLYDFNGSGSISVDEVSIMMRTAGIGLAKIDTHIIIPDTSKLEAFAATSIQ